MNNSSDIMDNDERRTRVESTNNGTTDKPVKTTHNATPAESTTNNNSTTTATNERMHQQDQQQRLLKIQLRAEQHHLLIAKIMHLYDSKQNAERNNNSAYLSMNEQGCTTKSENKAKAEDGSDSTNQQVPRNPAETLPSADIQTKMTF